MATVHLTAMRGDLPPPTPNLALHTCRYYTLSPLPPHSGIHYAPFHIAPHLLSLSAGHHHPNSPSSRQLIQCNSTIINIVINHDVIITSAPTLLLQCRIRVVASYITQHSLIHTQSQNKMWFVLSCSRIQHCSQFC